MCVERLLRALLGIVHMLACKIGGVLSIPCDHIDIKFANTQLSYRMAMVIHNVYEEWSSIIADNIADKELCSLMPLLCKQGTSGVTARCADYSAVDPLTTFTVPLC